jgi:hypothetical protein
MAVAPFYPDALKFARDGLSQDQDCLITAKVWDNSHETGTKHTMPKIVCQQDFLCNPTVSRKPPILQC